MSPGSNGDATHNCLWFNCQLQEITSKEELACSIIVWSLRMISTSILQPGGVFPSSGDCLDWGGVGNELF